MNINYRDSNEEKQEQIDKQTDTENWDAQQTKLKIFSLWDEISNMMTHEIKDEIFKEFHYQTNWMSEFLKEYCKRSPNFKESLKTTLGIEV